MRKWVFGEFPESDGWPKRPVFACEFDDNTGTPSTVPLTNISHILVDDPPFIEPPVSLANLWISHGSNLWRTVVVYDDGTYGLASTASEVIDPYRRHAREYVSWVCPPPGHAVTHRSPTGIARARTPLILTARHPDYGSLDAGVMICCRGVYSDGIGYTTTWELITESDDWSTFTLDADGKVTLWESYEMACDQQLTGSTVAFT